MPLTRRRYPGRLHDLCRTTLARLGASLGVQYCCHDAYQGGIQEVQAVFVSCPQESWIAQFGPIYNLTTGIDARSGRWLQGWEHTTPVGPVHCTGHLFPRSSGEAWVVVKQISIARQSDPTSTH